MVPAHLLFLCWFIEQINDDDADDDDDDDDVLRTISKLG